MKEAPPMEKVIRTEVLELIDSQGAVCMRLQAGQDGTN
jgi:hypothetical protein